MVLFACLLAGSDDSSRFLFRAWQASTGKQFRLDAEVEQFTQPLPDLLWQICHLLSSRY
jgi:hypothetical protein